jgi:rRNA maturation endonuclease Nob1
MEKTIIIGNGKIPNHRGFSSYKRVCKRCGKLFDTPCKNSHYCPFCIDSRSPIKAMMMAFVETKKQLDKEIDEDIADIKQSLKKIK